jgi:hypothetical protein
MAQNSQVSDATKDRRAAIAMSLFRSLCYRSPTIDAIKEREQREAGDARERTKLMLGIVACFRVDPEKTNEFRKTVIKTMTYEPDTLKE